MDFKEKGRRPNELVNTECLDDEVVRNKIKEANQLIDRVKKALHKIKIAKSGSQSEEGGSGVSKSNSTDIEETINNLKRQAAELITDNLQTDIDGASKMKSFPTESNNIDQEKSSVSTGSASDIQNQIFISKTARKRKDVVSDDDGTNPSQIDIEVNALPYEKETEETISHQCCDKYLDKKKNFALERPKTRRSEADDDLPEQVRKDKFRSCPERECLDVSSSLEELQAKLQTISESTESSYSTPRKKSTELPTKQDTKCCNTNLLEKENKEIQVSPPKNTVGICRECPREDKDVQTNIRRTLTKMVQVDYYLPKEVCLEARNFAPQDITSYQKNCSRCQVEYLPVVELLPCREKFICDKCRLNLKEEHLGGVSIHSKLRKLQRLHVQILPPIIIKPAMTLSQVLDLSIDPNGKCENRIINTQNVMFMEVENNANGTADKDAKLDNPLGEASGVHAYKTNVKIPKKRDFNRAKEDSTLKEIELFKKSIAKRMRQNSDDSQSKPPSPVEEKEKDIQKKALWYRSYHLYDNPNQHDPGHLDKKSLEKLSHIDFQYYKAFINPNSKFSEEYFTPNPSTNRIAEFGITPLTSANKISGFESKTVQCSESMLMPSEALTRNDSLIESNSPDQDPINFESQVTILKIRDSDKKKNEKPSTQADSSSSLSEITVTISYAMSEDRMKTIERNMSDMNQSEIKNGFLKNEDRNSKCEGEPKLLPAVDKNIIFKLHEKLKSVDTKISDPKLVMTKDSTNCETIDNFLKGLTDVHEQTSKDLQNSEDKEGIDNIPNKDEEIFLYDTEPLDPNLVDNESNENNDKKGKEKYTVNYMFNEKPIPFEHNLKHLELSINGRYKDEANMFTQVPYPTISNPCDTSQIPQYNKKQKKAKLNFIDHKDKELIRDRFEMIPRHKLTRYSPDISNSDTVTTTSISEGEILCKHSVSNGEIHICRHHPRCPRLPRNILTKNNFSLPTAYRSPHNLISRNIRQKFDIHDPKVSIEHRRNYFNNWVTYYVRAQDVNESSTSSCTNNKQ